MSEDTFPRSAQPGPGDTEVSSRPGEADEPVEAPVRALEREVDAVRDRLADTLSRLDEKRHAVTDPVQAVVEDPAQAVDQAMERSAEVLGQHRRELAIVAGLAAGAIGAAVAWSLHRARTRRRRLMRHRLEAAVRVWKHPEQIARTEPGFWESVARKVLMTALTTAAVRLVTNTLEPVPRLAERARGTTD
jgi:hypothetical protein